MEHVLGTWTPNVADSFSSHLKLMIQCFPDNCPKASDVMLFFLSRIIEPRFVPYLVSISFFGKSENKMYIDAKKFGTLRSIVLEHFSDLWPRLLLKGFEGINLSGWPEVYRDEQRKHNQAKFARRFKVAHKRRFSGVQSSEGFSGVKNFWKRFVSKKRRICPKGSHSARMQLQIEKLKTVIRLTDVTILVKVGGQDGETIAGTLEAHANGFVYIASNVSTYFYFDNIKNCFFRLGDKRMLPLLLFQLHDPIIVGAVVGTEKTKDIQFRLVHRSPGQDRSGDSDMIDEGNLMSDEGLNEDLKSFVDKVRERWNFQLNPPCLFEEIEKEFEFDGVLPSKAPASFALTPFSLVVLEETHFVVVPLCDIEIVNLAQVGPGGVHMTVICQDFQVDSILEINSIPRRSVPCIKHRLNNGLVKYYVNAEKPDWKSIVEDIVNFPAKFMENGGWDYLESEYTLAYYKETDIDPVLAKLEECQESGWKKGSRKGSEEKWE